MMSLKEDDMKRKNKKTRDPMARELLTSGKYKMRIVRSKKLYSRKEKHKKGFESQRSEPFLWLFPMLRLQ